MIEWQLKTPVAFIIFNRPDTTEQVFAEIAKAKPPMLLVVADGPRPGRPGEVEKCAATRQIIESVDWDCEVLTNFSDSNMGCKRRVSSGLDWVFEKVEEAIVLEDDCLPEPSFFRFCEELLATFRHDERVMMICGTSLGDSAHIASSYYYSRYPHIWGWASWRRVWRQYDVGMRAMHDLLADKSFISSFSNSNEYRHWAKCFESVQSGRVDTWDAQVTFLAFAESVLSVYPRENLVSNIGFGKDATHTTDPSNLACLPTLPMQFPLTHPIFKLADTRAEQARKRMENIGASPAERIFRGVLKRLTHR